MSNVENLKERIAELKAQKRAIILAHYYTSPEVQQVADFTGDSLALSQKAASVDADVILFAGVKFMAETAKVLSPERTVLLPVPDAGCSLADSCDAERLAEWKREHPGVMVVSYVNTSVEVKAPEIPEMPDPVFRALNGGNDSRLADALNKVAERKPDVTLNMTQNIYAEDTSYAGQQREAKRRMKEIARELSR